jgi:hypothetical protein
MEHVKKGLDCLPKISYDVLESQLQEGDVIYRYSGASGAFGILDVMKIAQGTKGGLSCFYDHPRTGIAKETPINPNKPLMEYFKAFEELRHDINRKHDPYSIKHDQAQRRLNIMKGDIIIRYKLVRRDGKEFEIIL